MNFNSYSDNYINVSFNRTLYITFKTDIKSTTVDHINESISKIQQLTPISVVLSLEHANLIDSLGLNLILSIVKHFKKQNINIYIESYSKTTTTLLTITRINTFAEIINKYE